MAKNRRRGTAPRLRLDGKRVGGPIGADDDLPDSRATTLQLDRPARSWPTVRADSDDVPADRGRTRLQRQIQAVVGADRRNLELRAVELVARIVAPRTLELASRPERPAADHVQRRVERVDRRIDLAEEERGAVRGDDRRRRAGRDAVDPRLGGCDRERGRDSLAIAIECEDPARLSYPGPHGQDDPTDRPERGPGCDAIDLDRPASPYPGGVSAVIRLTSGDSWSNPLTSSTP